MNNHDGHSKDDIFFIDSFKNASKKHVWIGISVLWAYMFFFFYANAVNKYQDNMIWIGCVIFIFLVIYFSLTALRVSAKSSFSLSVFLIIQIDTIIAGPQRRHLYQSGAMKRLSLVKDNQLPFKRYMKIISEDYIAGQIPFAHTVGNAFAVVVLAVVSIFLFALTILISCISFGLIWGAIAGIVLFIIFAKIFVFKVENSDSFQSGCREFFNLFAFIGSLPITLLYAASGAPVYRRYSCASINGAVRDARDSSPTAS